MLIDMPIPLYLVCSQYIYINGRLISTSFEEENVYHGIQDWLVRVWRSDDGSCNILLCGHPPASLTRLLHARLNRNDLSIF